MTYNRPNPNGPATAAKASPVVQPVQFIAGVARATPALNYEFLTDSTNGWFDALGYAWISFTVIPNGVSGGVISFECTNSTSVTPNGTAFNVQDNASFGASRLSSVSPSGTTVRQFFAPITMRYIRLRVSTAITGGSVSMPVVLSQSVPSFDTQYGYHPYGLANGNTTLGTLLLNTGVTSTAIIGYTAPTGSLTTDILSSALSTGIHTSTVNITGGAPAASFSTTVTAASGTTPTLDVVVQESHDGTTFSDLYHFDRITANGGYVSPVLRVHGNYIRYVRTIGGTSPSFTSYVSRNARSITGLNMRNYIDRTINLTVLNSTTAAYSSTGMNQIQMTIYSGSGAAAACTVTIQASDDGTSWWNHYQLTTNTSLPLAVSPTMLCIAKWVRAIVTSAGTGQTNSYVKLMVTGP